MNQQKKLSAKEALEIRENFDFFDRDGNGLIDEKEFAELLLVIEPRASEKEISKGFAEIDSDHDQNIDFAEFLVWWKQCWWQF